VTSAPDHLDVTHSPPLAPGAPDDGGRERCTVEIDWRRVFAAIAAFGIAALLSVFVAFHLTSAV
jgi:hypothetical protein